MSPSLRRSYLVLACKPGDPAAALWLEWPDAFGARWASRYLRSQGYAVTVLRGLSPDIPIGDGFFTHRIVRPYSLAYS